MKHFFESLIARATEKESLSDNERARMRRVLSEYTRMKPIRTYAGSLGIPSPFMGELRSHLMRPAAMVAALVLVIGTGGGVAYGAEGALPGEALYSVKVSVIEPARLALAGSAEEKASLHRRFAETRIAEAAELAEQGKLSPSLQTKIAARFEENSNKGTDGSDESVKVAFDARLAAYEAVLKQIDEKKDASSTRSIQAAIRGRLAIAESNDTARAVQPMMFAASLKQAPAPRDEQQVQNLDMNSALALKSSLQTVDSHSSELDATTTIRAKNEIERAAKLAEKGRALLKEGDRDGAYEAFQDALTTASRVEVFTRAAATLNINTFGTSTSAAATSTATTSASGTERLRILLPGRK